MPIRFSSGLRLENWQVFKINFYFCLIAIKLHISFSILPNFNRLQPHFILPLIVDEIIEKERLLA
jgi:hypothetical protein